MPALVTIQAQITRSIPSDSVYQVQIDIIDVTQIGFDVLVFTTEDSAFSHVASVFDMETYPIGQAAGAAANLTFFRGRGATVSFSTIRDATGFEQVTEGRLKILAVAWNSIVTAFSGTEIVAFDSTTSS
jgi:hypothetical protein